MDGEKSLPVIYWRLGGALEVLRGKLKRGEWGKHLAGLGIDRTRASRARAIRRCFRGEEELQGLTVAEAYGRRQRKSGRPRNGEGSPDDESAFRKDKHALANFIKDVREQATSMYDEAAFAEREEALMLVPLVEDAIRLLEGIRDQLRERTGEQEPA